MQTVGTPVQTHGYRFVTELLEVAVALALFFAAAPAERSPVVNSFAVSSPQFELT